MQLKVLFVLGTAKNFICLCCSCGIIFQLASQKETLMKEMHTKVNATKQKVCNLAYTLLFSKFDLSI